MSDAFQKIELQIFGQPVRISTDDQSVAGSISACFSAFLRPIQDFDGTPIKLTIRKGQPTFQWSVTQGNTSAICSDLADLIYVVEKTLTIELQRHRPELFFLHAAVVSAKGRCVVIAGESGAGKSTLCWDLCNAGFKYMSDELAPVNLDTMQVEAYPHAICLKRIMEHMPALPNETIRTDSTMHIPVEAIPGGFERTPSDIEAIVFLKRSDRDVVPQLTEMAKSEAAARFYANGLNQLAHERDGLKAAARLAATGSCFTLARGSLGDMRKELLCRAGL
uniref:HPr kinase n=1 Tax=uncultured bacterium ws198A12 TaxID=1131830 RepID=I1X5J3_9BACT|nr:HPr kinase [uncultured bacterium ws198A12]